MAPKSTIYDVIVLGLGGIGSAAAFHLAARGQRVLGIEQFTSPHDGSSHGHTRVIRQAYFEHPAYVPLLIRAYELWRKLERDVGEQLLLLPGGLMLGAANSEVVTGSIRSARTHGLKHEILDARDIRRRYPLFQVPYETIALFEAAAGLVFCERAVKAHLDAATKAGAELHFNEPASDWRASSNGGSVTVTTGKGKYEASQLVIAPGPWAPQLLTSIAMPFVVERQVLFWFQPPGGLEPFAPSCIPIYIWQLADGATPYGFPAVDGPSGGVKIAFYRKPSTETCTPATVDRRIRDDDVAHMRRAIRGFLPALEGELLRATTCLYTLTPDLNFVIGEHPQHPQVKLAAGFSGHGFKFCSVVGEILADLIIAGKTAQDISLFNPQRGIVPPPAVEP